MVQLVPSGRVPRNSHGVALTIAILLSLFYTGQTVTAQTKHGAQIMGSNSEGYRFMVGFMQNEINTFACNPGAVYQLISVASRFDATVTVTYPDGQKITFTLKPYTLFSINVPETFECKDEGVQRKAIEIVGSRPISVYCYSSRAMTSDGYLALPVNSWGTEYITANYYLDMYDVDPRPGVDNYCNLLPRGGEFAIIASEDATTVTVYPQTKTVGGAAKGQPYTRVLYKGDIFQIQDGGKIRGGSDITGSVVTSNKPVGLISGHVRAGVPYTLNSKDHLIEMLPPVNTLGKRYICVPFGGRQGGDIVRITSSIAGTTRLSINDGISMYPAALNSLGDHYDIDLTRVTVVTADQPVVVTQYAKSAGADPRNSSQTIIDFDPDMVVLTPEEQFVNAAVFQTLPNIHPNTTNTQFQHHYVTVVVEDAKFGTMRLNGAPITVFPGFTTGLVQGLPYRWVTVELPDNALNIIQGQALFGGYVYGLGKFDSYAWPVGSGLRKLDLIDTAEPKITVRPICGGGFEIAALDSGMQQTGLRMLTLDTAQSSNVTLDKGFIIFGDEYAPATVRLMDPTKPGIAQIIVADLAGNADTLHLVLQTNAPKIAPSLLKIQGAKVGVPSNVSVTITDTSTAAIPLSLSVDSIKLAVGRQFSLVQPYRNILLAPQTSLTAIVRFLASTDKPPIYYDTLIVYANDCEVYRIPILGTVAGPEIGTHDLDFGKLRVGKSKTMQLHVMSTGLADLNLQDAILNGAGFTHKIPFAMPLIMAMMGLPGSDTVLDVTFTPTGTGIFTGTDEFHSNADTVAVSHLIGEGIYPQLSVSGYDFGKVQIGDTACTTVWIHNTGTDTANLTGLGLNITEIYAKNPTIFPRQLAPGDSVAVTVCFAPTRAEQFSTPDIAQNSDGLSSSNTVVGTGYYLRAALSGYDWHERWIGTKHDTVVFLRNRADDPVTISRVWIDNGDIGEFTMDPLQASVTLNKGDSMPVNVSFLPLQPGLRSCIIKAETDSRITPVVDSVLLGFGLYALASDTLKYSNTMAYSCGSRDGWLVINNEGNAPLTLSSFGYRINPAPVSMQFDQNAVAPGTKIAVGEQLWLNFTTDFNGFMGPVDGLFTWQFNELPQQFSRVFTTEALPQFDSISAHVPVRVATSGSFDLVVGVDSLRWRDVLYDNVQLTLNYSPLITWFDEKEWQLRKNIDTMSWRSYGDPVLDYKNGQVKLTFVPAAGNALPLWKAGFMAIPFRGFLGNKRMDTITVTMNAAPNNCTPPAVNSVSYMLDSICGLTHRLFVLTGAPYKFNPIAPNPVRGKTNIGFTVGMDGETTLEIYNANGSLSHTLVNRTLSAGEYSLTFDADQVPNGVYFFRLRSGPFQQTQYIVVAK